MLILIRRDGCGSEVESEVVLKAWFEVFFRRFGVVIFLGKLVSLGSWNGKVGV